MRFFSIRIRFLDKSITFRFKNSSFITISTSFSLSAKIFIMFVRKESERMKAEIISLLIYKVNTRNNQEIIRREIRERFFKKILKKILKRLSKEKKSYDEAFDNLSKQPLQFLL